MSSHHAEYFFECSETNFVNAERLGLTLRFVPTRTRTTASVGELITSIAASGVQPKEIVGVYKVSSLDSSFTVQFKFSDTLEHVAALKKERVGDCEFEIMKLNEQVVNPRIHWLPLFYDSLILTNLSRLVRCWMLTCWKPCKLIVLFLMGLER